ncbi:MAG: rRNA maturation RNase YbeY [Alphaproteobacteria bacterium]|nr:rRNA maturation RNase YbeY [Alphaproteobacteria bacterium]
MPQELENTPTGTSSSECDQLEIDIYHEAGDWDLKVIEDKMVAIVKEAWQSAPEGASLGRAGEVSIILADNGHVQELNRDWRGKDKPTNVLSFAAEEGDAPDIDMMPAEFLSDIPRILGDIILAHETVLSEADEQNKKFEDHLAHLVLHGVLHLLGYDHIEDNEAEEMEQLETSILARFNISDPYQDGAHAPDV